MTKTLIVPGLDGSDAPHWQHWWAATDPSALMVDLSDPARPVPAVWEIELASMILQHPDCILVGHSLGAVLIARLLARWPHFRIRAALLVAPAETHGNDRIGHFGQIPELRREIPTLLVASRNDPWMAFGRAAHLSQVWGSELIDLGNAGHINVASGFGPWAKGKSLRDALRQQSQGRPAPMEVYRMAGELDYLLRVAVPDMAAFDQLYKRLTDAVPIKNVTSHFAMERMKFTTAYPLDTLNR